MLIIRTNCDTQSEAENIAKVMLKDKLATVAHIVPVKSFYLWKGNMIEGKEFVVKLKTAEAKKNAIVRLIKEMHSYEIPPITFVTVDADKEYLDLIKKELKE